jgi:hypothetical protein
METKRPNNFFSDNNTVITILRRLGEFHAHRLVVSNRLASWGYSRTRGVSPRLPLTIMEDRSRPNSSDSLSGPPVLLLALTRCSP